MLELRGQAMPGAARCLGRRAGDHHARTGAHDSPLLGHERGRKAGRGRGGARRANRVDIVKIWVDTRDGKYKKLTQEIYGAIIDEAHRAGAPGHRAHLRGFEDAKGLIRAGIDAFAHGVQDRDVDDELMAMLKQRPSSSRHAEPPRPGCQGGPRAGCGRAFPHEEFAKLEAANTDQPAAQAAHAIQARNLAKMNAAGVRLTLGTDGNRPWRA